MDERVVREGGYRSAQADVNCDVVSRGDPTLLLAVYRERTLAWSSLAFVAAAFGATVMLALAETHLLL